MPKVQVTYVLPDEQEEYELSLKAAKMATIIYDFTSLLRDKIKYASLVDQTRWDPVNDEWWKLLKEEGYDPYES
jgi:hypothetical protein